MRIPDPYFEDVPCYGDLRMEKVIVDYVYPLLSVLKDSKGQRYLCMCFDTRGAQRWLVTPIRNVDLIKLLQNSITLSKPFEANYAKKILATRDYESKSDSFCVLNAEDIPSENLPAEGEYLDAEDNEWKDYIDQIATSSAYKPGAVKCIAARIEPSFIAYFVTHKKSQQNWVKTSKYQKRMSDCYAY